MADGQGRSKNQKLKLLYIKQFFEDKTDDRHSASVADIINYLEENDIHAERKSIYDDIKNLENYGLVLRDFKDYGEEDEEEGKSKHRYARYQLMDRDFELREVKLISDSIASSKFLSERMSNNLIKKLGTLVSEHQRKEVRRQVSVMGRAKTMNDSALNMVDHIHQAIEADTTITFQYYHYSLNKSLKLDKNYSRKGELIEVSPWALLYDNDSYYLLAYTDGKFMTYRVDRMTRMAETKKKRQGKDEFEKIDMPSYTKSTFGMYNGTQEKVTMVFQNRMLDTVIDKFGKDVMFSKVDDQHFKVTVPVAVSPQFFAWVFGLGNYVTITEPESVVKQMKDMLGKVSKRYK